MWQKIYRLITAPEKTWQEIKLEQATVPQLVREYALPLLLLPVLTSFLRSLIARSAYLTVNFVFDLLVGSLVNYIMLIAALLFAGWIVSLLARYFEANGDLTLGVKVVVYSMTPVWLVSICQLLPHTRILALLGLYSAYLLFAALPIVLETKPEKQLGLGASIIGFGLALMMYLSIVIGGVFYY
jgi:hypothetical protein